MFRKILALLIVGGALAGFASYGSALFTDSQAVDANAFTAGTIDITTDPTTALVTFSEMAPGDTVTAPITVDNNGTLELRYAVTSTSTNTDNLGLRTQLDLTIKSGVTDCTTADFATDGTIIYGPGDLAGTSTTNLIGDPTTGDDTGDRTLAAGADEDLCFQVSLPSGTGNAYQNAETTATFTFSAEQTTNNP